MKCKCKECKKNVLAVEKSPVNHFASIFMCFLKEPCQCDIDLDYCHSKIDNIRCVRGTFFEPFSSANHTY